MLYHCMSHCFIQIVDCQDPRPPMNGTLEPYLHTTQGATVAFRCNAGYRPSAVMTSYCSNSTEWIPVPSDLNCTLVIGQ